MNLEFLPLMLEGVLVLASLVICARRGGALLPRKHPLIWLTVALAAASSMAAGSSGVLATVKLVSFLLMLEAARQLPRFAGAAFYVATIAELIAQAALGNILNKYSTVPYLMLAAIWLLCQRSTRGANLMIICALAIEIVQALAVESRGLLIGAGFAAVGLFTPKRLFAQWLRFFLIALPVVYPILMMGVFIAFTQGKPYIEATASNFERSATSAWVLTHLGEYVWTGPGSAPFSESLNWIKQDASQELADFYDPHQFLLSSWIWHGTAVSALFLILWVSGWWRCFATDKLVVSQRTRLAGVLAILATLTFVLSAPDATRRIEVALAIGLAGSIFAEEKVGRNAAWLNLSARSFS